MNLKQVRLPHCLPYQVPMVMMVKSSIFCSVEGLGLGLGLGLGQGLGKRLGQGQ